MGTSVLFVYRSIVCLSSYRSLSLAVFILLSNIVSQLWFLSFLTSHGQKRLLHSSSYTHVHISLSSDITVIIVFSILSLYLFTSVNLFFLSFSLTYLHEFPRLFLALSSLLLLIFSSFFFSSSSFLRGRNPPGGTSTLSNVSTAYFIQQGRISQMALQSSAERLQLLQDVIGGTSFDLKAKEIQTLLNCCKREAERVQEQVESLGKKFDEMTEERKELRECLSLEGEKERIEYVIAGKRRKDYNEHNTAIYTDRYLTRQSLCLSLFL